MTRYKLAFVSFEPNNGKFIAFLPIDELISSQVETEDMLKKAARIYNDSITKMHSLVLEIGNLRLNHKLLPARKIWQFGDAIFELRDKLEKHLKLN